VAVVLYNIQDNPPFDCMAETDKADTFALVCGALPSGVKSGMTVTQNTGSDMNVAVASGTVNVLGAEYPYSGAGSPFAINAAGAGTRRDMILARLSGGVVSVIYVAGTVPTGLVGAWTRNTPDTTCLPPVKGAFVASTDVILAEVVVEFNTTAIVTATNVRDLRNILGGVDVIGGILQSSTNVKAIINTNPQATYAASVTYK
jgi:hypothetical protein